MADHPWTTRNVSFQFILPFGGAPTISLDGRWSLRQTPTPNLPEGPLNAMVPGDILTDLQRAGRVKDPYWNITWRDPSFISAWNTGVWTYSKTFPWAPARAAGGALLVLDGVKMGALVTLNGAWLGNATDEWRRYVFPLNSSQLRPS